MPPDPSGPRQVFEENRGQAGPAATFVSRCDGFVVQLDRGGMELILRGHPLAPEGDWIRLTFPGARTALSPVGIEPLHRSVNYLVGADPRGWLRDVPTVAAVRYPDLFPGIDLTVSGDYRRVELEFALAPQAERASIAMDVDGPARLAGDDATGGVLLETETGGIRLVALADPGNGRARAPGLRVRGNEVVLDGMAGETGMAPRVRLALERVHAEAEAPVGPHQDEEVALVAVDGLGRTYVAGRALAAGPGGAEAFVARFDRDGASGYTTYFGDAEDMPRGLSVGEDGGVTLTGWTRDRKDAFDLRLATDGSTLVGSTEGKVARGSAPAETGPGVPAAAEAARVSGITDTALDPEGRRIIAGIEPAGGPHAAQVVEAAASGGVIFAGPAPDAASGLDAAGCPGTIRFDNSAGTGLWQTATNWDTNVLPGPADDVCIPAGANVTLSSGSQSINTVFVESGATLSISAGSLSLAAASQVDGGLTLSGGILTGAGDITTNGVFSWTGGQMTGTGTTNANAGIAFSGASVKDIIGRVITTAGTTTWSGGSVRPGSGAVIRNSGTWDVQGDTSFVFLGGSAQFVNQLGATFKKSAGAGTLSIPIPFTNTGTLAAQSGTISLAGTGSGAGAFTASPGAVLAFGFGTYALLSGSTLDAPVVSVATGGVLDVSGTYTVTTTTSVSGTARFNPAATLVSLGTGVTLGTGILDLNSGEAVNLTTLSLTAAGASLRGSDTVTVSDPIAWTTGSMSGSGTTNASAGILFSGAAVKDITGRVINTAGTTTWSGGPVRPGSGTVIRNSGTWDVQGDTSLVFLGGSAQFVNEAAATFKKSAGSGSLAVGVSFVNAGTLSVLSGTVSLNAGGSGTGTYSGSAGTSLGFGSVPYTLSSGSVLDAPVVSVAGAGFLDVFGTYTASITTDVSGTARFNPASTLVSLGTGLTLASGILDLNSGEPVNLTTLALTGPAATLRGTDTVTVSDPLVWTAGSMTGTGTTNANAGIAFSGASVKDITGRVITTAGTTTWSGGQVRPGSGAVIRNSGTWDVQGDASMVFLGGAQPLFANQAGATFRKSAGSGTLSVNMSFTNAGDVSSQAGTIILAGGGSGDGSFSGSPGTALGFEGSVYTLLAGATVDAPAVSVDLAGTLVLSSGTSLDAATVFVGTNATLDVSGAYTVSGSTTLSTTMVANARFNPAATLNSLGTEVWLANGVLELNSGEAVTLTKLSLTTLGALLKGSDTVTVSDPITWISGGMSGTGTTNALAGIVFSTAGVKDISEGRTLNTSGTTTWTAGQFRPGSGAVIRNSGLWDVQGDLTTLLLGGVLPRFVNQAGAEFRKSAGTGTSSLEMAFDNAGTLSVLTGTVALNAGGSSAGSFAASPGSTLVFGGGIHTLLEGSSLQAPVVSVGNGATLDVSGDFDVSTSTTVSGTGLVGFARFNPAATVTSLGADVALPNGILELNSGEPIAMTTLSLTALGSTLRGIDTVTVSGPITWTAGSMSGTGTTNANGGIAFSGSNVKDLTGSRLLQTGGTTTWTGGSVRPGSGAVIRNAGIWDIQADTSMALLPGTPPRFDNLAGATYRKSAGAGTASSSVPFANAGAVRAIAGTLSFSGGYSQSAGSTIVEGGVLSSSTPLDIQAGTVGGSGTIAAAVTNAGRLAPGLSPGLLNLAGTCTQTAAASYDVELGGLAPGTAHDKVAISGPAGLAGTLNVILVNGFVPADLDTFTIVTYASSAGSFSAINLPTLGGDLVWKVHHDPTAFVLEVLADLDGDGVRNSTDCRPSDPTVWAAPAEVGDVGFAANGQTVTLTSLAAQAGPATIYDVMRGRVSELPVGGGASETCAASGVAGTQVPDPTTPALGTAIYYLARGSNVCGVGTWGSTSTGAPRVTLACP